jgi:hypothetical protein
MDGLLASNHNRIMAGVRLDHLATDSFASDNSYVVGYTQDGPNKVSRHLDEMTRRILSRNREILDYPMGI